MKNKFVIFLLGITFFACNKSHQKLNNEEYAALTDEQKRSVEYALEGINLEDPELELTLFASEPMMTNPTNMDIDDKGRVWICEGYNYRNKLNPRNPYEKKGDRILIMEDTDGDGKADKSTVFYQGEDINAALGIAVLGNKVFISCSPNVFVFTDENGDDVPDKKEILFTGIGGEQHDHGMHSFVAGPDGKLYFNYGNAGQGLLSSNDKPFYDPIGRVIKADGKPYREGMVYRMNTDGSDVEILAWNFRNNYEVALDSYSRMWQSDNDDDGNRGTRINYVMDYGNYGFKDEMTGADWRTRRTNLEDSVYQQHWHLNDPGVVPNLLQTYAGSPTGILVYEGDLLPEKYRGQIIHCDAGPNVLRAYPVQKDGAGFKAELIKILDGNSRDNWFRPSDVTVAPDGSLFISDWYDPGVGGHAMGDADRGRIYRLAPKGHQYAPAKPDYSSIEGNLAALQSPNQAIRYKAFQNLKTEGIEAESALLTLWNSDDSRMKARAFWLLALLPEKGSDYILKAAEDQDENIKVASVRAMREKKKDFSAEYLKLAADKSPQVRREVALAIRYSNQNEIWNKLADQYDGKDRWYLEALGIAADNYWDSYLDTYLENHPNWSKEKASKDIVWRSRAKNSMNLIGQLIKESSGKDKLRYFRALDFQPESGKNSLLLGLLENSTEPAEKLVIFKHLQIDNIDEYPKLKEALPQILASIEKETDFLDIVKKFRLKDQEEKLLSIVEKSDDGKLINESAGIYIDLYGIEKVKTLMNAADTASAKRAISHFGVVDKMPVTNLLISIFSDPKKDISVKREAMEAMNGWESEEVLWKLVQADKVPDDVMDIAKRHMLRTWHSDIRSAAGNFFKDDLEEKTPVATLMALSGNPEKGQTIFETYCISCHLVNGKGVDFGPGLSQIGKKLSKDGLFNAILNPSEGMGFGYETQEIKMKDGSEIQAIVTSKTENEVNLKLPGQSEITVLKLSDVKSITQKEVSLMPAFPLKDQEYADLVSYLSSLK